MNRGKMNRIIQDKVTVFIVVVCFILVIIEIGTNLFNEIIGVF